MAKAKATHQGECQLCGHVQKLPGGALALHGYTKKWGFFSGTCPGSRHEPYEISCALIEVRIPTIRRAIEPEKPRSESKVCSFHGCRRHKLQGEQVCYIHERRARARAEAR